MVDAASLFYICCQALVFHHLKYALYQQVPVETQTHLNIHHPQKKFNFHFRRGFASEIKNIFSPTGFCYVSFQFFVYQVSSHIKKLDKVGFSGAIGANKDIEIG
jgi:hypothetical protein